MVYMTVVLHMQVVHNLSKADYDRAESVVIEAPSDRLHQPPPWGACLGFSL